MVTSQLDAFARQEEKPLFISETGYRNSANTLYHTWDITSSAPKNPQEQAVAIYGELANVLTDAHIKGIFFWGWNDVGEMSLAGTPATQIIHGYYTALQ